MSRRAMVRAAAVLSAVLALTLLPTVSHADSGITDDSAPEVISGDPYPGDQALESLLIAAEERRLIEVRAISNAAGWTNVNQGRPYRLITGNTYTLVLISRESPYTLDDLEEFAPSTFVRQPDGSYLLSENIIVEQGATLRLDSPGGLVLHLASNEDSFVSIVTLGGAVELVGSADRPIEVSSWDAVAGAPDTTTSDGRSYLRVIGGHADFSHVEFHDLGFWAGTTGGVSLTGTEVPEVLSTDAVQNLQTEEEKIELVPQVYGSELFPAGGDLQTLSLEPDLTGYSYVSAVIHDVVSRDNAFGLFIASADGVDIRDTIIENSLVDGLVLHRYVKNTIVRSTVARNNAVDGINLTRATTGIVLDRVTSESNGRNGITMEAGPLAEGPTATGTPVGSYGNNELRNSTSKNNGRYGIEVIGGGNIALDGNTVTGHTMGIVVSTDVETIVITDNIVEGASEQGIALRNGVTNATVQGNSVVGPEIGIYLRDAGGLIDRNIVEGVSNHAITLISATETSTVSHNTVSGIGPSAIDIARAGMDTVVESNDLDGWQGTKPLDVILRSIFQPLTVMWLALGLLVLISAITSVRRRKTGIVHPYAHLAPLSSLTKGVVSPTDVGVGVEHRATSSSHESISGPSRELEPAT